MWTPWLLIAAIAALALLYVVVPVMVSALLGARDARVVGCPETGLLADVRLDARLAALTAVPGPPRLRVVACSLWPERRGCAQACLAHARGR